MSSGKGMPQKKLNNHFFEGNERRNGLWLVARVIGEDVRSPQSRVGIRKEAIRVIPPPHPNPRPREKSNKAWNCLRCGEQTSDTVVTLMTVITITCTRPASGIP